MMKTTCFTNKQTILKTNVNGRTNLLMKLLFNENNMNLQIDLSVKYKFSCLAHKTILGLIHFSIFVKLNLSILQKKY